MWIAPSPRMLLHQRHDDFGAYCLSSIENRSYNNDPNLLTDYAFLSLSGINPRVMCSKANAVHVLIDNYDNTELPNVPLLLGLFSRNLGQISTSNYFFKEASKRGSVVATNAIGINYYYYREDSGLDYKSNMNAAITWHNRSLRMNANEAYMMIATIYVELQMFERALYYYSKHFTLTDSPFSATQIATLLIRLSPKNDPINPQLLCRWLKYSASFGYYSSVSAIVSRFENGQDSPFQELHKKYNAFLNPVMKPPKQLCANLKINYSTAPFLTASNLLNFADPFKEPNSTQLVLEYHTSILNGTTYSPQAKTEYGKSGSGYKHHIYQSKRPTNLFYGYPSENRTQIVLQIFNHATSDIEKRNLAVVKALLEKLYGINQRGIIDSTIWRTKCKYGTAEDLVRCGFIAYLLHDLKFAYMLFQKAAMKGNNTGAVMVGLIFAHNNPRRPEEACYFFAKSMIDPVSLIHLGLICDDQVWLRRAGSLLSVDPKSSKMFEWMGDLLSNGVKFPEIRHAAAMFYGVALEHAEQNGEDNTILLKKASIRF